MLFEYLDVFYIVYLDDILIYFKDPLKHEIHVKLILEKLRVTSL
jgi:hypothetical protein